jgi:uncharacterized protein (DUF924 family)
MDGEMDGELQPQIQEILQYWFGAPRDGRAHDPARASLWWSADPAVDAEIATRFGARVEQALAGALEGWRATPRGCLALVILLDQFTRNIGRGTAAAFRGDAQALEIVLRCIERREDRALHFIERSFLYMPLMHAEDRAIAACSVRSFEALSAEIAAAGAGGPDFLSHARQHAGIVQRFGRYPHRNAVLGRESTAEERAFLEHGGPSFGQQRHDDRG